MSFYELQAPTEWANPPATWSSTTIDDIEACPRRWQLLRSRWGEHDRFPVRPSPAAIEGQIVHEALDRLTRACGQRGNPAFGSAEFVAALTDADFFPGFAHAVAEWQHRLTSHPRPDPAFRLRASADELANRAVRMFREQYKPDGHLAAVPADFTTEATTNLEGLLLHRKALSEVRLRHPELAFLGILDRVQLIANGVEVVDFKTGKPREKHRRQLLRYALLWWRATGEAPVRISAQYLDGVESWPVTENELATMEADLANMLPRLTEALLSRPTVAKPGPECRVCPVRARCSVGWAIGEDTAPADGRGDAELIVTAHAARHGFLGRSRAGADVAIVYEPALIGLIPSGLMGHTIRILDGVWRERRSQLEIKAWSEVFVVIPGAEG